MVFWEALRQLVNYRRLKGTAGPMSNFHAGLQPVEQEVNSKSWLAGCFDLMTLLGCKAPQPHFSPLVCYGAWRDCLCHVKNPFSNFQTRELWRKNHVWCLSKFIEKFPVFRCWKHHRELVGLGNQFWGAVQLREHPALFHQVQGEMKVWDLVTTGSGRCEWSC